jgi:hypothetical protein
VNVPLLLELVAGVLAAYDLVDRRGRAPTSWAVLASVNLADLATLLAVALAVALPVVLLLGTNRGPR